MPKRGYRRNTVGNVTTITSTLYLVDFRGFFRRGSILDQIDPPVPAAPAPWYPVSINPRYSRVGMYFLQQFAAYAQTNINSIWSTTTNRGLQPPFNNSGSDIICQSQVVVVDFLNDALTLRLPLGALAVAAAGNELTLATLYNSVLNIGEALFEVGNLAGRSYIGSLATPGLSCGDDLNMGTFFLGQSQIGVGAQYAPPSPNTPAHEFGHMLGLADRYRRIANNITAGSGNNLRSGVADLGDIPMYLPGIFDSDYDTENLVGGFPRPHSFTGINPFGMIYTTYTPPGFPPNPPPNPILPNYPNGINSTPQPNYNKGAFYDFEYSTLFGWMHNIMSNPVSVDDANYRTELFGLCPTYNFIYNSLFNPAPPLVTLTIIITQVQLNVMLDYNNYEYRLPPFLRFAFFDTKHPDTFGSMNGNNILVNTLIPYDTNLLNRNNNQVIRTLFPYPNPSIPAAPAIANANRITFVGLVVNNDWTNSSNNWWSSYQNLKDHVDWKKVPIVSDSNYEFNSITPTNPISNNLLGIADVMDFRMFSYNSGTDRYSIENSNLSTFLTPFNSNQDLASYDGSNTRMRNNYDLEGINLLPLLNQLVMGNIPLTFAGFRNRGPSNRWNGLRITFEAVEPIIEVLNYHSRNIGIFMDEAAEKIWNRRHDLSYRTLMLSMNPQTFNSIAPFIAAPNPFPAATTRNGTNIIRSNIDGGFGINLGNIITPYTGATPDYLNVPRPVAPSSTTPPTPYPIPVIGVTTPIIRWEGYDYRRDHDTGALVSGGNDEEEGLAFYFRARRLPPGPALADFIVVVKGKFFSCRSEIANWFLLS